MSILAKTSVGLALVFAFCAWPALAGSVVPMTVETLANHAGQVVIGRTAAIRSYWADDPRSIESEVTLQDVQYLKGALPDAARSFTFTVPGGAIDGFEMRLGCAPGFAVGEKWLLFLLPTYKTFPVVGVSTGALRIIAGADGIERLYDPAGVAVAGVDERGFIRTVPSPRSEAVAHLREGLNARLALVPDRAAPVAALSVTDFVARIRPVLAASKDHALTAPAGRRADRQAPAVPLQAVGGEHTLASPSARPPRGHDAVHPRSGAPRPAPAVTKEQNE